MVELARFEPSHPFVRTSDDDDSCVQSVSTAFGLFKSARDAVTMFDGLKLSVTGWALSAYPFVFDAGSSAVVDALV